MNDILSLIMQRRSIRKFTDQPVEEEKVELLLKAAMAAPTAMNLQPWEFIVIRDEAILSQIRKTLTFGKMVAPLAIVVCGNLGKLRKTVVERFWVQDCSAATQNILLAAVGFGLGSVWCGVYPINNYQRAITSLLQLPEGIVPLNVIYIGYPAETKESHTKYSLEKIHLNQYNSK